MAMSAALLTMAADGAESRRKSSLPGLGFNKSKPIVDITLNNTPENCYVPSFTTLEKMEGTATIKTPIDVAFDSIHLTFQGSTTTYVEKLATSAPTNPKKTAFHVFLRLQQPLKEEDLPEDGILKAGTSYSFPFTFVVPERLLPQACAHAAQNHAVSEAHSSLPPSLGDPMMAGDGKSLLDDMAPDNVRVSYGLRVFALRKAKGRSKPTMLFDSIKKVRIVPATLEAPPVPVSNDNQDDYVLTTSKTIRKGVFKGKLGTLSALAAQPAPFFLKEPSSTSQCPVTTLAKVNLRFDPVEDTAKPPKLGSLVARIKAATFYGVIPEQTLPAGSHAFQFDTNRGLYVDTVSLSHRCLQSVSWDRHEPAIRRDSVMSKTQSTSSTSEGEEAGKKKKSKKVRQDPATLPFYTAEILLPLFLPQTKSFVPTFHSCLVSRIYMLDVSVTVHPAATASSNVSVSTTNFHLKIPVQIAAHGNAEARPVISEEEAASIARREADGYFEPRTISLPDSNPQSPPALEHLVRGARGSIFTPRWGSASGTESGDDGADGPLPPRYTGMSQSAMVIA